MKETKSDRTKAFILEKVSPIFNAKGYAGTSLTDVLNATGLTKGSIYGNFENKEDLALKAFKHNLVRVLHPLQEEISKEKSAIKKLRAIVDYYRNYYHTMEVLGGCPILNVVNDARGVNPLLLDAAEKSANSIVTKLEEIILLGIKQKKFKSKTNASEMATVLYAMIEGAVFLSYVQKQDTPLKVAMNAAEDLINAMRKSSKPKKKQNGK